MKNLVSIAVIVGAFLMSALPALAHVVVKPNQAGVGEFQTFTVGVPNEKDNPTVGLRLIIPDGLNHVSPNVKPGWSVEVKKQGDGEDAKVSEINWSGGAIPNGQRDDFLFSAQVPASESTLNWKAYQTYQNGDVISWDQDPSKAKGPDDDSMTPFSQTKVINDLKSSTNPVAVDLDDSKAKLTFSLSIAALALSVLALGMQVRKK